MERLGWNSRGGLDVLPKAHRGLLSDRTTQESSKQRGELRGSFDRRQVCRVECFKKGTRYSVGDHLGLSIWRARVVLSGDDQGGLYHRDQLLSHIETSDGFRRVCESFRW